MIGSARTTNPTADGIVSKNAKRIPRARIERNSSILPTAALLETSGRVTVPIATPNTPSGSCIRRNAMLSQLTGPSPKVEANELLTSTLTCTALAATTAGPISTSTVRTPSSFQWKSGLKRNPTRKRAGNWAVSCQSPPTSVPMARPMRARGPKEGSIHQPNAMPLRIEPRLK